MNIFMLLKTKMLTQYSNYKNKLYTFYNGNKVVSWFFIFTLIIIILGSCYYLFSEKNHPNFKGASKVWELASYTLTALYTFWFWFLSKEKSYKGKYILNALEPNKKVFATLEIALAIFVIVVITLVHFGIHSPFKVVCSVNSKLFIFYSLISKIWEIFSGAISIFLLFIYYALFCRIARIIIIHFDTEDNLKDKSADEKTRNEQIKNDIKNGLQYVDKPTCIAFLILSILAFILCYFKVYEGMEMFFSGAIAFELILSAIAWVNTDTA